jgi:hypothetical protein
VRAWDVETRRGASVLEGHANNLSAVCLTPSGRQIASAGVDRDVRLWDLKTRRMLRQFSGHEAEVTSVAFTPDGRHLISGGRDKTVRVWDVASGKCERVLSHTAAVLAVALTPGGSTLLSAVADRTLRFWHLDWEPEERALPPWDEKARPFLESFVSLRLKPETVRTTAPWTDGEVDALLQQMRHRGFGGLQKDAVVGRLRDLAQQDNRPPSFWDEVREGAPRTGPVSVGRAAPAALQKDPVEHGWGVAAVALSAAIAFALVSARGEAAPRRAPAADIREHLFVVRPAPLRVLLRSRGEPRGPAGAGAGAGSRGQRVDLACVARSRTERWSRRTSTGRAGRRRTRRASSAISGGRWRSWWRSATPPSTPCATGSATASRGSDAGGARSRRVVEPARPHLPGRGSLWTPRGRTCGRRSPPRCRSRSARGQVEPGPGWEMTNRLVDDPDPQVRQKAAEVLFLFNAEAARPAAERLAKDPDPVVAEAGRRAAGLRRDRRTSRSSCSGSAETERGVRPRGAGGRVSADGYWTLKSISSTGSVPVAPALFVKTYCAVVSA